MAPETIHTVPSIARLVGELFDDFRTLTQQHIQLMRHEIEGEVKKVKRATISVAIGASILAVSGLLFIIMLVHLVQWSTEWPLWVCYGIVATAGAIGGLIALWSAVKVGGSVHVLPVKTMQSMKEDAQWIKQTIISNKT
ncbi:phage holin family protein [Nitrospira sp. Nam80]